MVDIPINKIKIRDSRYVLNDIRIEDIDDELIEGSKNPVTSGAVKNALADAEGEIAEDVQELIDGVRADLDQTNTNLENTARDIRSEIQQTANGLQHNIDIAESEISDINAVIPEDAASHGGLVHRDYLHSKFNELDEGKVDKIPGKNLSTEDYTTAEKQKLSGIESGAEVNIINEININGTELPVINKKVSFNVPTQLAELADDSVHRTVTDDEKEIWNAKQSTLVFDEYPTENSNNPVKSKGIKSAIDAEAVARNQAIAVEESARIAADNLKANISDLATYVNNGSYNSSTKNIELKHDGTILVEIDATAFIKDGMVNTVEVINGNLVISFNTDAGKEDISIPIGDIFDASNYYNKTEADTRFLQIVNLPSNVSAFNNDAGYLTEHQDISGKANISDLSEVAFSGDYEDLVNIPEIPEIPENISAFHNDVGYLTEHQDISGKANVGDSYTKLESDNKYLTEHQDISGKANISDLSAVATSGEYSDLSNKPTIPSFGLEDDILVINV